MYHAFATTDRTLAIVYFSSIILLGNFVLLNLFLAILLKHTADLLERRREKRRKRYVAVGLREYHAAKKIQRIRRRMTFMNAARMSARHQPSGALLGVKADPECPLLSGWEVATYSVLWDKATAMDAGELPADELGRFLTLVGQPLAKAKPEVVSEITGMAKARAEANRVSGRLRKRDMLCILNEKRKFDMLAEGRPAALPSPPRRQSSCSMAAPKASEGAASQPEGSLAQGSIRRQNSSNLRGPSQLLRQSTQNLRDEIAAARLRRLQEEAMPRLQRAHYIVSHTMHLQRPLRGVTCGRLGPQSELRRWAQRLERSPARRVLTTVFAVLAGSLVGLRFAQVREDGYRADLEKLMGAAACTAWPSWGAQLTTMASSEDGFCFPAALHAYEKPPSHESCSQRPEPLPQSRHLAHFTTQARRPSTSSPTPSTRSSTSSSLPKSRCASSRTASGRTSGTATCGRRTRGCSGASSTRLWRC